MTRNMTAKEELGFLEMLGGNVLVLYLHLLKIFNLFFFLFFFLTQHMSSKHTRHQVWSGITVLSQQAFTANLECTGENLVTCLRYTVFCSTERAITFLR